MPGCISAEIQARLLCLKPSAALIMPQVSTGIYDLPGEDRVAPHGSCSSGSYLGPGNRGCRHMYKSAHAVTRVAWTSQYTTPWCTDHASRCNVAPDQVYIMVQNVKPIRLPPGCNAFYRAWGLHSPLYNIFPERTVYCVVRVVAMLRKIVGRDKPLSPTWHLCAYMYNQISPNQSKTTEFMTQLTVFQAESSSLQSTLQLLHHTICKCTCLLRSWASGSSCYIFSVLLSRE